MCPTCRYPPCTVCKKVARPKKAKYSVERIEVWICGECQLGGNIVKHTCHGKCNKQLPADAFDRRADGHRYTVCKECQHPKCTTCGQKSTEIWTPHPKIPNEVYKCSACEKKSKPAGKQTKKCKTCEETDASAFDKKEDRNFYDRCRNCQHPKCSECGHESAKIWTPNPKIPNQVYRCTACVKREAKNHL